MNAGEMVEMRMKDNKNYIVRVQRKSLLQLTIRAS